MFLPRRMILFLVLVRRIVIMMMLWILIMFIMQGTTCTLLVRVVRIMIKRVLPWWKLKLVPFVWFLWKMENELEIFHVVITFMWNVSRLGFFGEMFVHCAMLKI
jgi:hypothetical protein